MEINSRLDEAQDQISNLEDKEAKKTQSKHQRKRIQKDKAVLRGLWNNIKHTNIHIMGVTKGGERASKELKTYLRE